MKKMPSPNFDERAGGRAPELLILHYTGMKTPEEALARLCDPKAKVSAHYVVDEAGAITQLVSEEKRAWHAGISSWAGQSDINSASIGIEIVNPGHEFGYPEFPLKQMESLRDLCAMLVKRYAIAPHHVLGHSDVAPGRKQDPGELFNWLFLAKSGIGLWPAPEKEDYFAARKIQGNKDEFMKKLYAFGYDKNIDDKDIVDSFYRHFFPEKLQTIEEGPPRLPDTESLARILFLCRQKAAAKI